jgi:hypothetical protein
VAVEVDQAEVPVTAILAVLVAVVVKAHHHLGEQQRRGRVNLAVIQIKPMLLPVVVAQE